MTLEELKALDHHLFEDGWNKGNLAVFDEVYAPDFAYHNPLYPDARNLEGVKQLCSSLHTSYPDMHFTFEQVIAEGDMVVTRWAWKGTSKGEAVAVPGTPASGKVITNTGFSATRYAGGKAVEGWSESDGLGVVRQLGFVLKRE